MFLQGKTCHVHTKVNNILFCQMALYYKDQKENLLFLLNLSLILYIRIKMVQIVNHVNLIIFYLVKKFTRTWLMP